MKLAADKTMQVQKKFRSLRFAGARHVALPILQPIAPPWGSHRDEKYCRYAPTGSSACIK
jgi:hypothetical protein